jgi:DNA modification methylase
MTSRRMKDRRWPATLDPGLKSEIKGRNRDRRESLRRLSAAELAAGARRNDPLPPLELAYIPLDELRISPRRLRKLDPAHVREIANAIATLGFCPPILIGKNNIVIDGVARIEAARLLGLESVPCIRVGHLSDDEQRILRLAVNRLAEKGEWDLAALKIEFNELILKDAPIEISGFTPDEIDQIVVLDPSDGIERGPLAPEADAVPVARLGDMFRLGPHCLICGDATDPAVLRRLMRGDLKAHLNSRVAAIARGDLLARLLLSDEPYNVRIAGNVTGGRHREFAMASGEMTPAEFLAFNEAWMGAALPHLADGGVLATFIDWRGYPTVDAAAASLGLDPLNLIVWAKTNAGMGSLYRSQHELLPLFKKGDAPHVNNVALGKRGRWRSNLWTYPGASSLGSDARRGLKDHPTVKPTAMLEDALLDLTYRGDIVLDPFLGSGSTLIAAHKTGRVCRGVEIDPLYVDVIVRRFEAATGEAAVLMKTGQTFAEVTARRARESDPRLSDAGEREALPPAACGRKRASKRDRSE